MRGLDHRHRCPPLRMVANNVVRSSSVGIAFSGGSVETATFLGSSWRMYCVCAENVSSSIRMSPRCLMLTKITGHSTGTCTDQRYRAATTMQRRTSLLNYRVSDKEQVLPTLVALETAKTRHHACYELRMFLDGSDGWCKDTTRHTPSSSFARISGANLDLPLVDTADLSSVALRPAPAAPTSPLFPVASPLLSHPADTSSGTEHGHGT